MTGGGGADRSVWRRPEPWIILGVAAVIAVVRVGFKSALGHDGLIYMQSVVNWVRGQGFTFEGAPSIYLPPGFGLTAWPFVALTGDLALAGALCAATHYLVSVALLIHLGRRLWSPMAGLLAGLLWALSPVVVAGAGATLNETTFTAYFLAAFALCCSYLLGPRRAWKLLLAGPLLGLCYLLRPEGFLVGLLAPPALFLGLHHLRRERPLRPRRAALHTSAMLLLFGLTCAPYLSFLHREVGFWTLSTKTMPALLAGEITEGPERLRQLHREHPEYWDPHYKPDVLAYLRSRGWIFPRRVLLNAVKESAFVVKATAHALAGLGLLWLLVWVRRRRHLPALLPGLIPKGTGPLWLLFLHPLGIIAILYVMQRFLIPYVALLLLLAGALGARALAYVASAPPRRWPQLGAALLLSVLALGGWLPPGVPAGYRADLAAALIEPNGNRAIQDGGRWIAEHLGCTAPRAIWVSRKPEVLSYTVCGHLDGPTRGRHLPKGTTPADLAAILRADPQALALLDRGQTPTFDPALVALLEDPAHTLPPLGLAVVHEDRERGFLLLRAAPR